MVQQTILRPRTLLQSELVDWGVTGRTHTHTIYICAYIYAYTWSNYSWHESQYYLNVCPVQEICACTPWGVSAAKIEWRRHSCIEECKTQVQCWLIPVQHLWPARSLSMASWTWEPESAVPWIQEGQPCAGVHQARHGQLGKGRDFPALVCSGFISSSGAVLGGTI